MKNIYTCLVFLIISSTLVTSRLFIYRSLTPYFLYLAGISLLVFSIGFSKLAARAIFSRFPLPLYWVSGLVLYVTVQGYILPGSWNSYHNYLIANCFLFFALFVILTRSQSNAGLICHIIAFAAVTECCICLLQYFGIVESLNPYFRVSGTWENPNITAMFLAMAVPCILSLYQLFKPGRRKYASIILAFLFLTLLVLQCRTALIGAIVGVLVVVNNQYHILQKAANRKNLNVTLLICSLTIAFLIPLAHYAYSVKKTSADGRLLIWKISLAMVKQQPGWGFGYGSFEKNYNLFQALYFKDENGSFEERQTTGYVRMGYNEFIQNAVEGGLLGLLLWLGIILSLLITPKKIHTYNNKHTHTDLAEQSGLPAARAGVVIFSVMSVFNFTIQAIPVMCLLMIYGAIVSSARYQSPELSDQDTSDFLGDKIGVHRLFRNRLFSKAVFLALGISGLYLTGRLAKANVRNNEAALLAGRKDYRQAVRILRPLATSLNAYESYWTNYANILVDLKDYKAAIPVFRRALELTSNPENYLRQAECYRQVGAYSESEQNLLIAENIEPNRMASKVALMNLYLETKDTAKTIFKARVIVNMIPKIPSSETQLYQKRANALLQKLDVHYRERLKRKWNISSVSYYPKRTL